MRGFAQMVLGVAGALLISGCHTAMQVSEHPRVDLELVGGNRGYLVGMPPAAREMQTTRQMVETVVEVPSFYKPRRAGAPASLEETAPPETDMGVQQESVQVGGAPGKYDTYVVQKGDSLWSIAAKPQIYGNANRWRRIYDANRDLLKSPDRLRAGMTLKIPRGRVAGDESTTYGEEGVSSYKK